VVSINLADELVILVIFVNNKHFVNTGHNEKGVACGQNGKRRRCVNRDSEQFSKSNNSCV